MSQADPQQPGLARTAFRRLIVAGGAIALTLLIFLFLPLMQTISERKLDRTLRSADTSALPPPPPPPDEQIIEQEEPPEPPPPPDLAEEAPPLELSQLELALNTGFGDSGFGEFQAGLMTQLKAASEQATMDRVFSLDDLDQRPRPIFQRAPVYPPELFRARRQGTVYVVFQVDERGRVQNPKVGRSSDADFNQAALDAVKQWRFEPGTRGGKKVAFRLRYPITFNPGQG